MVQPPVTLPGFNDVRLSITLKFCFNRCTRDVTTSANCHVRSDPQLMQSQKTAETLEKNMEREEILLTEGCQEAPARLRSITAFKETSHDIRT
ncbi:hypothetical protein IWQ49_001187 [Labrenzia sp. EL_126]|nr:hypothetical protein [Labrenzia sp. EL_126]